MERPDRVLIAKYAKLLDEHPTYNDRQFKEAFMREYGDEYTLEDYEKVDEYFLEAYSKDI